MNNINVAIIGCGKQAEKHISGLDRDPEVNIFLADIDLEKARSLADKYEKKYIEDIESIFRDESLHAVDICTPTPSHERLINSCIDAGKHFFCEKPLTENLFEAEKIVARLDETGVIGMVGYLYRFAPVFEFGQTLFRNTPNTGSSEVLGNITIANFRLSGRGSHQPWKHRKEQGGGAVNEMLVHMIDLVIWYFGSIRDVDVLACDLLRPRRIINGKEYQVDAEDFIVVRLAMGNGIVVICHADMVTPAFIQSVDVQGENGTFAGSIQAQQPSYLLIDREAGGYRQGRKDLGFENRNLFDSQMAHFIDAVRTGNQPSRCTVHDGVLVMQTIDKIKQEIK